MGDLPHRQEKFVEGYLSNGGNATRAALSAGYSPSTAAEQGYENLRKPNIREYIKARMLDSKVTTDEIIGTLVSQMRGDVSMVLNDQGEFDLALAKERKLTHLIKRYKVKSRLIPVKDSEPEKEITVELELYDSQMAAKHLCTVFGLEKLPAANPETVKALDAAIQRFVERAAARGIEVTPEDARDRLIPYFESESIS